MDIHSLDHRKKPCAWTVHTASRCTFGPAFSRTPRVVGQWLANTAYPGLENGSAYPCSEKETDWVGTCFPESESDYYPRVGNQKYLTLVCPNAYLDILFFMSLCLDNLVLGVGNMFTPWSYDWLSYITINIYVYVCNWNSFVATWKIARFDSWRWSRYEL